MWPFTGHKNTRYENEIRRIFETYRKDLSNQLHKARHNIDAWCENLIGQIKRHADEQKRLLDDEYDDQRDLLDAIRRDYLDTSIAYEQSHQYDQLRALHKECENLKIKVAEMQYSQHTITFIDVMRTESDELFACRTNEKSLHINTDDKTKNTSVSRIQQLQIEKRRHASNPQLLTPNIQRSRQNGIELTQINEEDNNDTRATFSPSILQHEGTKHVS